MIVLDASVALRALIGTAEQSDRAWLALGEDPDWYAPGVFQFEVLHQLREIVVKSSDAARRNLADEAFAEFGTWEIDSVAAAPLVTRVWELRHNFDAGDALGVAAAEHLGVPLLTADRRMAKATGARCEFRYVP